jgi:hypothetical protein
MPKVSDYELDHMADDSISFEKVRRKKNKSGKENAPQKKKHRETKID